MYSGINIKAKEKNCTNIEGIEVHSSILSEKDLKSIVLLQL